MALRHRLLDYEPAHRAACLAVFDGCLPTFVASRERPLFDTFLGKLPLVDLPFVVVEVDGRIAGCGGVRLAADGIATMCWGLFHPDWHRQGLGTMLLGHRLAQARSAGMREVHLDTSQHTRGFYERFGFRVVTVTKDGYGPGLHEHDMVLTL